MDLRVVKKYDKTNLLDTSVTEKNFEKYATREKVLLEMMEDKKYAHYKTVFLEMLEDTRFELGNAKRILEIMNGLNRFHVRPPDYGRGREYFFFSKDGDRAFASDFYQVWYSPYFLIPLAHLKMVQCPGCPKMQILIGHENRDVYEELVVCGNSVYVLKREEK